jgi:predicted urease superfamily metal-dependent hydrolase
MRLHVVSEPVGTVSQAIEAINKAHNMDSSLDVSKILRNAMDVMGKLIDKLAAIAIGDGGNSEHYPTPSLSHLQVVPHTSPSSVEKGTED